VLAPSGKCILEKTKKNAEKIYTVGTHIRVETKIPESQTENFIHNN